MLKTAYDLRISDWSSDVCSSDLGRISDRAHVDQCARRPDLRRHQRNHENPDRPRFVAATLRRCEMTIKARVAGVGMVPFQKPSLAGDWDSMAEEAINLALADAGLHYSTVQQANAGFVYGDSTPGQAALTRGEDRQ